MSVYDKGLTSPQKALAINLNDRIYGTFAEIGAGQEVARHFFRSGAAAGTIAKSMSAYDMTVSDAIYGKAVGGRYVCEERLENMLNREYIQLLERLDGHRPQTTFFVFADTVAAKSYNSKRDGHGWLGVKFQDKVKAGPSEVIIHVNMLDKENFQQQEALGILGVNLLYACYHYTLDAKNFILSLIDNLSSQRIEIDMIRVSGPAFDGADSRLLCLELVRLGLCQVVFFDEAGQVHQPGDTLYKKNLVIARGSYRPPTLLNVDTLQRGLELLKSELPASDNRGVLALAEISMNRLVERGGEVDSEDFLARVDLLAELKQPVLISNFQYFGGLAHYFNNKISVGQVRFVIGHYALSEVFDETKYKDFRYGMLGCLGELMGERRRIYVYPAISDESIAKNKNKPGAEASDYKVLGLDDFECIDKEAAPLLAYLKAKKYLVPIKNYDPDILLIWSRVVLKMIQKHEPGWESMVPKVIVDMLKARCLFGVYCEPSDKE